MTARHSPWIIRLAHPDDVTLLAAIESAGDTLFADAGHPEFVGGPTVDVEIAQAAVARSDLWVIEVDGAVVGFALLGWEGDERALHQISVHPDVGRTGCGTALIEHVIEECRSVGDETLVLNTQTDVPWNQPWYERVGFAAVPEAEWTPAMAEVVTRQATEGLDWATRVHMRLRL